ncbi:MAG: transposase [Anaerolineae bacterium]
MSDQHAGWHSGGYLPHWDAPNIIQSITFRLADSLPASLELRRELESVPDTPSARIERVESLLDAGRGSCALRDPRAALIVEDALMYFDGDRYRLLAWVVMPNHVHVLIEVIEGHALSRIVQSRKTRTAYDCNRLLGRRGRFWEPE